VEGVPMAIHFLKFFSQDGELFFDYSLSDSGHVGLDNF
jgi:hypothetical protein